MSGEIGAVFLTPPPTVLYCLLCFWLPLTHRDAIYPQPRLLHTDICYDDVSVPPRHVAYTWESQDLIILTVVYLLIRRYIEKKLLRPVLVLGGRGPSWGSECSAAPQPHAQPAA